MTRSESHTAHRHRTRRIAAGVALAGIALLGQGCGQQSAGDAQAADVVVTPTTSPSGSPTAPPRPSDAPTFSSCEELGPVFTREYEYEASFLPEEGAIVIGLRNGHAYRVDVDDSACQAAYPMVADEVRNVVEGYESNQRSECRGVLEKLAADPSAVPVGHGQDLTDPEVRARLVTYAQELCSGVGIAVPPDLH